MFIGFMRNQINPTYMAKLTAMLCKYHGIEIIYLRPWDVDVEKNTVTGKVFLNNTWVTVNTELPLFIDISPFCFNAKNQKVMDHLKSHAFLTDDCTNRLTKEKLQAALKEDKEYAHLVIPTSEANSFDDLENFINKYSTVVLKPIYGRRGMGIYILRKETENYVMGHKTEDQQMTKSELKQFFEEAIKGKQYILQKYISSRTLQGDPFDCRIHAEKNGNGKWEKARNYIRIGIGQKVISNVNQGGGISDPEPFLKANFGDKWEEINQKLNKLAITLPSKIEELRNTHIRSLGMDIGIDKDGEVYLFEVNNSPETAALKAEAAMLRTEYFQYVIKHKLYLKKK